MSATFSAKSTLLYALVTSVGKAFTAGEIGCALNHSSYPFRGVGKTRLGSGGSPTATPGFGPGRSRVACPTFHAAKELFMLRKVKDCVVVLDGFDRLEGVWGQPPLPRILFALIRAIRGKFGLWGDWINVGRALRPTVSDACRG